MLKKQRNYYGHLMLWIFVAAFLGLFGWACYAAHVNPSKADFTSLSPAKKSYLTDFFIY